ncbi:CaiB/BaiF CoA transferase family protein [Pseudorhodoferax sp.]|uniref:CaiB/BaiF CoA transferase family protein n=1 Tax=Pseudorhodoferax sp. TaxID=1993553 RepID=UPI002DD67335|nr:CaiB/BaiF CoA-transferase family protein [Pseudorhodoferax sp.]
MTGVLAGVRIVEIAGIGPGPFCAMLLADLGAEVISIERPGDTGPRPAAIVQRGKRSIVLDLKAPGAVEAVLRLLETADGLIEGMRPGVMERLGLSPQVCLARRPALVYGRMTGWGQHGPLAQRAGHDSNYTGLAGALWFAGPAGQPPAAPTTVLGDIGGGALYLALGLVAGILRARSDGRGQVVDAAIVDGTAHMLNLLLAMTARGAGLARGVNAFDAAHWAGRSYRCRDGGWINLASLEPQFYAELLQRLGLDGDARFVQGQHDAALWPALAEHLARLFAEHDRAHWCAVLDGSDACWAPVLRPDEAAEHPHLAARGTYLRVDGVLQAAPAPRFGATPSPPVAAVPRRGAHTEAVLAGLGLSPREIAGLQGPSPTAP